MPTITLYSKPNCPLCDHARHYLRQVIAERPDAPAWTVDEVSILDDQDLYAAYRYVIPVVVVDGGTPIPAPASLDVAHLRAALDQGPARATPAPAMPADAPGATAPATGPGLDPAAGAASVPGDGSTGATVPAQAYPYPYYYGPPRPQTGVFGAFERFGNGMTTHWLAVVNTAIGIFSTLPWLAPVFAALGWWFLADPIYTIYMFFCHQLPERAGNLFGYQVAYCYRNSAIYTTIFLGGLLFAAARRGAFGGRLAWMLRPIRWQVFVVLLVPIAVDGLTHMFGLREDNAWFDTLTGGRFGDFSVGDSAGTLNWWLRVISGAIFGFAVVRLVYPWVLRAVEESRSVYWVPAAPVPPYEAPQTVST
ncbi:MAG TPA: DUF2085 domain-containing protein [Chloroflexia bacterium]